NRRYPGSANAPTVVGLELGRWRHHQGNRLAPIWIVKTVVPGQNLSLPPGVHLRHLSAHCAGRQSARHQGKNGAEKESFHVISPPSECSSIRMSNERITNDN